MISTNGITLGYGQRSLFKDVTVKFLPGNCYGLIGANGAGKSTFLKILSGEIQPDHGDVVIQPGQRIAVLKQNQFEFDDVEVLKTVIMGNKFLYDIIAEKEALYAKADFSDADGIRASELEGRFAELNGWDAESQAAEMLHSLGIGDEHLNLKMRELEPGLKFRVLLAQALFGNPDILLLDEPTNNLDLQGIMWLEEFLCEFNNTVVVVSHDRHFLDKVCTHIADIDFGKLSLYTGNYSFWYEASQLALRQQKDTNKKAEDRIKELKSFIERFSANASKSKQATSRKKQLDKLSVDEIKPSTRRYPHVHFAVEREAGKDIVTTKGLALDVDGRRLFSHLDLTVNKGDKIAFVGKNPSISTGLFHTLMGDLAPLQGELRWGITVNKSYFPKENGAWFQEPLSLIDWLRQYVTKESERDEEYIRGFLGRMLFSGEEATKKANVLSGGEKVRCMLARMMMARPNVIILDEPTNHLDLESITAVNNGLINYSGTVLFTSQDREFVNSVANRIIEITPKGIVDKQMKYDDYLESTAIQAERARLY
ncbi:MAG: ATP-binding cassette domain-containing protein [Proteobacteria bacterium]|nr:ATP-binding cassette domain-containing protein [Pseudomonadota bacterium]